MDPQILRWDTAHLLVIGQAGGFCTDGGVRQDTQAGEQRTSTGAAAHCGGEYARRCSFP